jgi:hypothetical protein
MHYIWQSQNQERAAVCLSSRCSALVRFPALSQIKPHDPLLVVILPSILLNFFVAKIHSTKAACWFPTQCVIGLGDIQDYSCVSSVQGVCEFMHSPRTTPGKRNGDEQVHRKPHQWYPEMSSFMVKTTAASNGLCYSNFRSWLKKK